MHYIRSRKNMVKRLHKLIILGALMSGMVMAISACDFNRFLPSSNSSSQVVVSPESITVVNNKEVYEIGEELDITVTAHYSDESSEEVTNYQVTGFDNQTSGEKTVTVTYLDKTYTFNVTVKDPTLVDISVTGNKDTYAWGEDLDITVLAHYSNNTYQPVTDYEVTGFDSKKPGEQVITVTYEEESYSFNVVINEPHIIKITASSSKKNYEWGENISLTVYAHYVDGKVVAISDYEVDGYNSRVEGLQNVTITYGDFSCSLTVNVNERKNLFPADKMNTFIYNEGIETTVPSPIGYFAWTNETSYNQEDKRVFTATTSDEGTVGNDSIADQYSNTLKSNGWTVSGSNGVYEASKAPNDAKISFSTSNQQFSFTIVSYSEFPNKGQAGVVIKSSSSLKDGDTIALGSLSLKRAATSFSAGSFSTKEVILNNNELTNVSNGIALFTAHKSGSYWTFSLGGKLLGATSSNSLVWDEGVTQWTLSFSGNSAIITNKTKSNGRLYINKDNNALVLSKSMSSYHSYPEIFRLVERDNIYPTSISLSGRETLALTKTCNLSVNYSPSNTNVFNSVSWTSSNKNVATVNNGLVTAVSTGETTITAKTKSKNKDLTATYKVTVNNVVQDRWTVMIYMCGADLESASDSPGLATLDIEEILSVSNQPEDVNIIIETGGAKKWQRYNISASNLSRYHVENKKLVLDEKLANASMGKQSTFESFLNWGLEEYPAEKTGVIFWNHGGALDGCCYDENYNDDSILNSEASAAFKNAFKQNNIDKLEFVGYDCCLMQVQDIAEFNSHYFNYMVASEEAEDGYGWDYDNWLDDLYADKDTPTILKATCDSFVSSCGLSSDQTLSYLDLSKINDYYTKFEEMSSAIYTTVKSNYSAFKTLIKSAKDFGDVDYGYPYGVVNGYDSYGTIDAYDFLNKLENNTKYSSYKDQIDEVKESFKELVAYSKAGTGAGNANGLTLIYGAGSYVTYNASETAFTNWRSLFN